jgi:hypothetical protein
MLHERRCILLHWFDSHLLRKHLMSRRSDLLPNRSRAVLRPTRQRLLRYDIVFERADLLH